MKKPKIKYSKPSIDIQKELNERLENSDEIFAENINISNFLKKGKFRDNCMICSQELGSQSAFKHRGIYYVACETCEHVQTKIKEPNGYPYEHMSGGFENLYLGLDEEAYENRKQRIYKPKLDWVVESMQYHGVSTAELVSKSWLEIGCGAGHFLQVLSEFGVEKIKGLDVSRELLGEANKSFETQIAFHTNDLISDLIRSNADIVVAFFVIEHLQNPSLFWHTMSQKKKGTILIFSVPTFGICAHTEAIFADQPARNFDNVYHTQLYSEGSIKFILEKTNYAVMSEWIFGQDSQDLISSLLNGYKEFQHIDFLKKNSQKILALIDPIQNIIDRSGLSDSRHIIAIKT